MNPIAGDTYNPSVASHHAPIHIHLKDSSKSPSQPQYPISQEHQQGLKPIITKLYARASYAQFTLPKHPYLIHQKAKWLLSPGPGSENSQCGCYLHTPSSSKSRYFSLSQSLFHYALHCSRPHGCLLYYPFTPRVSRPGLIQSTLLTADIDSPPTRLF